MSLFLWASVAHKRDAEQIRLDSTKLPTFRVSFIAEVSGMTGFHLPIAGAQPRGGHEAPKLLTLQLSKGTEAGPRVGSCSHSSSTWPSSAAGCALVWEESLAGDAASAGSG